ncbi:MAG TPA: hypothetical protein VHM88_26110, partial [Candidatus Acidoferrales bacterium]|nr:hypothetical protein [Candidatus Acidoferrales bacterium]
RRAFPPGAERAVWEALELLPQGPPQPALLSWVVGPVRAEQASSGPPREHGTATPTPAGLISREFQAKPLRGVPPPKVAQAAAFPLGRWP